MPEIHLIRARFAYISCGLFAQNKGRIQKFNETADLRYILSQKTK